MDSEAQVVASGFEAESAGSLEEVKHWPQEALKTDTICHDFLVDVAPNRCGPFICHLELFTGFCVI